jgi:hypothetical protein
VLLRRHRRATPVVVLVVPADCLPIKFYFEERCVSVTMNKGILPGFSGEAQQSTLSTTFSTGAPATRPQLKRNITALVRSATLSLSRPLHQSR